MTGYDVWVGLVSLKRPRSRSSRNHGPTTAYATIVARAKTRFSFRHQAVEHAKSRGWRLERVLVAEPLERWLAPDPDEGLDDAETYDPVEDAREEAEMRSLAGAVAADGVPRSSDWDEVRPDEELPRSLNERLGDGAWQLLWWVGVPIFMAFTLPLVVQDIGPAYRAEFGHGTPGVFTATARECDKTCDSTGDWSADDGSRVRHHVTLATGAGAPYPGDTKKAIDVGDRVSVYPTGGSWDWLLITGFLLGFTGISLLWLYLFVRRIRER